MISSAGAGEWVTGAVVEQVSVNAEGHAIVVLDKAHTNPDGCNTTLMNYIRIPVTLAGFDAMLSLAISAKVSGVKVRIYIDGCHATYVKASVLTLEAN